LVPQSEPAIIGVGLTKKFNDLTAVNNLNISVEPGEIFGLVGPDGAGKTTILRMLSGILKPTAGNAMVAGYDVNEDPLKVKDNLAYMSQRFGLYVDLTVEENIEFYADLYGEPKKGRPENINELLDFSYMRPFKKRLAGNLSGGMKQKLQLVCALIHTPRVLLLDEPTNGVDPVSRRDFWRILYQLLNRDVAILVTTAYLDEAERCSRVGLIERGTLLAVGTPAEVKGLVPGGVLTIRSPQARQVNKMLREKLSDISVNLFGDTVHVVAEDVGKTKIKAAELLDGARLFYEEMHEEPASLEDVFVAVLDQAGTQSVKKHQEQIDAYAQNPENFQDETAVTVDNLTRRFGTFVAVNQVSFEVPRGQIFGFLGPNGAGKSTVIRMLCGLLKPSEGQGSVAGFDINTQAEQIKQNIGYMSQKFSLYEDLTVEENINFYGGIYGLDAGRLARRREWACSMAGLEDNRHSLTAILSTGWKQRLAMACAILHEPPIIFLDEPTSGVDPLSRRRFWDIIYEMAEMGVTVFVTTHYMEEAEYCDRIALIYRGNLIAMGSPGDLKAGMKENILDIQCPDPQDAMGHLESLPEVRGIALFGSGLHAVVKNAALAETAIRNELSGHGIKPDRIEKIVPDMEDVFVSLIEEVDRKEAEAVEQNKEDI